MCCRSRYELELTHGVSRKSRPDVAEEIASESSMRTESGRDGSEAHHDDGNSKTNNSGSMNRKDEKREKRQDENEHDSHLDDCCVKKLKLDEHLQPATVASLPVSQAEGVGACVGGVASGEIESVSSCLKCRALLSSVEWDCSEPPVASVVALNRVSFHSMSGLLWLSRTFRNISCL